MTGKLISACLMVKNESANLNRCLKSIKQFVDEIIIVDTGSVDNTLEIARHYGARIYNHPWEDDFSKHRNQSISYAEGEWVFIIDADEELVKPESLTWSQVREIFKKHTKDFPAAAVQIRDIQKGLEVLKFNSTRFFRNGKVKYEGIVHNQPIIEGDGQAVYSDFLLIRHYGYDLTPEQKHQKFLRTSGLLLKLVEEDRVGEYGHAYFYLCQIYANNGYIEDALKWGEKYLEYAGKPKFNDSIYFTMMKQYMTIADQKNCERWLHLGLDALPGDLDMAIGAMEFAIWVENEDMAVAAAKDWLEIFEKFEKNPIMGANRFVYSLRTESKAFVLFHLTRILLGQGSLAMKSFLTVVQACPEKIKNELLGGLEAELSKTALPIKFVKNKPQEEAPQKTQNFVMGQIN